MGGVDELGKNNSWAPPNYSALKSSVQTLEFIHLLMNYLIS